MNRLGNFLLDMLQTIVLAVAIFMVVYLFLVQPHQVSGNSMVPNFQNGEYLLTNKVSYKMSEPERGDVIVFEAPNKRDDYIKRIIGLPGESMSIKDGKIYINNQVLEEDYLPDNFTTQPGEIFDNGQRVVIAPNEYIVLGDNRSHSSDSRVFGAIKKDDIVGKAWFIYWPPQYIGLVPHAAY